MHEIPQDKSLKVFKKKKKNPIFLELLPGFREQLSTFSSAPFRVS